MPINEPDNVTEYFIRHGCDRKTTSFPRPSVVDLVKPLLDIVAKLPINGDGDPIVPGDRGWITVGFPAGDSAVVEVDIECVYSGTEVVLVEQLREDGDECWEVVTEDLFSSREAAEAAREAKQ